MRFAAKMTALITMLLAVSLAVGGYLVMSSSFDARLKGQVRDAQEEVRLLGMTVQALCAREQGQDTASSGAIERAFRRTAATACTRRTARFYLKARTSHRRRCRTEGRA